MQFDRKQILVHSAADQPPIYTGFRVLAEDLSRQVTFGNRDNNEIKMVTDYNGSVSFGYDDWGRMTSQTRGSESAAYGYVMGSKLGTVTTNFGGASNLLSFLRRKKVGKERPIECGAEPGVREAA